jgi:hypothetical protein
MNNEELNNSLVETIKKPELESLATDLSEIVFDQLSEVEGVAKDIPVVGSIVKLLKIGFSVKDIILFRKLGKFLWTLSDIPLDKRIELIRKLENDSNYKTEVGAKIMLLLERTDDFEKPKIMANAFKAYLYNEITYIQLQKINFGIDRLFIGDIKEFYSFYRNPEHSMDESTHQNFALCGIAYLIQIMGGGTKPKISDLGILFAEKVLERDNINL